MIDRNKCMVMAAAATCSPLPEQAMIQSIKSSGVKPHFHRHTLSLILECDRDEVTLEQIEKAHEWHKKFKRMDDRDFIKKRPDLHHLWLAPGDMPKAISSGGNQGASSMPKKDNRLELINTLNVLRRKQSLTSLDVKKVKATVPQLEKRIEKIKKTILKDSVPAFKVHPPAVAEGAYKDNRAANAKTAHTTGGKTKAQEKREGKRERFIEARVSDKHPNLTQLPRTSSGEGESLADIAATIKMDAKTARRKARLYKRDIEKLEIKGTKYRFHSDDRKKVLAVIQRDGRK